MTNRLARGLLLASLCGCALAACASRPKGSASEPRPLASASRTVVVDGDLSEWSERAAARADRDSIYFRISVEGFDHPLQGAPESLSLWLDADGSGATGLRMPAPPAAAGLGVDLVIQFSGRGADGRTRGVQAWAVDASGARTEVKPGEIDLVSAPTFAAPAYEVRVGRHTANAALAGVLGNAGAAKQMFVLTSAGGQVEGWSDPETFSMPAAGPEKPLADESIPAKPPGAVRVLSWNVEKGALAKNPSPFSRIFQVVQPDIILLQEWDADAATAQAWFTATVTGEHEWHARTGANDVVIVSPYPIAELGSALSLPAESMSAGGGSGDPRPVRFAGGLVQTPQGVVAAGTLHLKCCGTSGSSEDARRRSEAGAINGALAGLLPRAHPAMTVIGGDWNLVGTRAPLDILRGGLDSGAELAVAHPMVLGDAAMYTWRDDGAGFPPGRLDYIVYSGSSARAGNAFVLDTTRLSDGALARLGLDRTDTSHSDHLPVVVDLLAR
jgi:endonuclease/exonuclease/phosphatase family metal-dependent hydrolase